MKKKLFVALALLAVSTFGTAVQAQVSPQVTTFIKTYANFISSGQVNVTPEDVQATSDGGYIVLAGSVADTALVSWLTKIDSSGTPEWSKQLGFFSANSNSGGASVQQTRDGGYVIAGGGVVPTGPCSASRSEGCAMVQKLNSSGDVEWASVYNAAVGGSVLTQIRQTPEGGYIAVGGTARNEAIYGALILRLDRTGNVLWQKVLGPHGRSLAKFNQVVQTVDGGFAALGFTYIPQEGPGIESVLVAKYSAAGVLQWEYAYNQDNGTQVPLSLATTSDGGFVVSGTTSVGVENQDEGVNALLLKLGPRGSIHWEKAYSAYLYPGAHLAQVAYSVHQTADGGYVLAGDSSTTTVCGGLNPWMTKVDASGNQLWVHVYYQMDNGCALSEYFASSALSVDGGILALGSTEDYLAQRLLLYAVKTDGNGLCSSGCSEVYPYVPSTAIDMSLRAALPLLPANTTAIPAAPAPSESQDTTIVVRQDCD